MPISASSVIASLGSIRPRTAGPTSTPTISSPITVGRPSGRSVTATSQMPASRMSRSRATSCTLLFLRTPSVTPAARSDKHLRGMSSCGDAESGFALDCRSGPDADRDRGGGAGASAAPSRPGSACSTLSDPPSLSFRLKIPFPQGSTGSSPVSGTTGRGTAPQCGGCGFGRTSRRVREVGHQRQLSCLLHSFAELLSNGLLRPLPWRLRSSPPPISTRPSPDGAAPGLCA